MKAMILAAGKGTRLYPMTRPVSKPLIPVYDKPLIYYSLYILIRSGLRDILIIVPPGQIEAFEALLGDGSQLGVHISYKEQFVQRGIADALLVGEEFIAGEPVTLMLGDNIFFGGDFLNRLQEAIAQPDGAAVFGYPVEDPRPFGVVEFDGDGNAISLEEKPKNPRSHFVVPGIYVYDHNAVSIAKTLQPSARGELEITDLNRCYLNARRLKVYQLDTTTTWMDAGTADSVLDAAVTIRSLQNETGLMIGCIEQAALRNGYITLAQAHALGRTMSGTTYGAFLESL